jgi:hypothetical protein
MGKIGMVMWHKKNKMFKILCAAFMTASIGSEPFVIDPAHAIYTRHDREQSDYVVSNSKYPALVDLLGKGDCIGSFVHASYVLTVAHCAQELKAGMSLTINGNSHTIKTPIFHPKWNPDNDEYDIALVPLDKPVKNLPPLPIYRKKEELNAVITIVGRGDHATGLRGEIIAKIDGKLRRATNKISAVNEHFLEITFERAGEKNVTPLEGVGGDGDSGAPGFIDINGIPHIAGLNAWAKGHKGIKIGQYGTKDYQTRVSSYLKFLDRYLQPR